MRRSVFARAAVILAFLAAAFTGCGDSGGGIGTLCAKDDACHSGLVCRQYICTKPCQGSSECGSNNTCSGGYCYEECEIKRDCSGLGAVCPSGTCRNPNPD
jgi:hypothetical protein